MSSSVIKMFPSYNLSYSFRKRTPEGSQTNTHGNRVLSTPKQANKYRGRSLCDSQTGLLLDSEALVDKVRSIDRMENSQTNDQMGETHIPPRRDSTDATMHIKSNCSRKVPNNIRGRKAKTLEIAARAEIYRSRVL